MTNFLQHFTISVYSKKLRVKLHAAGTQQSIYTSSTSLFFFLKSMSIRFGVLHTKKLENLSH